MIDDDQLNAFAILLRETVPISGGSLFRTSFPDHQRLDLTTPFAAPMDQRLCRRRGYAFTLSPGFDVCPYLSDIDPRLDETIFDAFFPRDFMGVLRMPHFDRPEGRWKRFDQRVGGPASEWLDTPEEVLDILRDEAECSCQRCRAMREGHDTMTA